MINYRRNEISSIEKQFNVRIFFFVDQNLNGTNFYVTSTNSFSEEDEVALKDDLAIKSLPNTNQKFKAKPKKKEGKKDIEHKNFIKHLFGKIYK